MLLFYRHGVIQTDPKAGHRQEDLFQEQRGPVAECKPAWTKESGVGRLRLHRGSRQASKQPGRKAGDPEAQGKRQLITGSKNNM